MIDAVKKALADYAEFLTFEDRENTIKIRITKFLPANKFQTVYEILVDNYAAKYTARVNEPETDAFFIIMKSQSAKSPQPAKSAPAPKKFAPSLPEDTMITVTYSRKVCPKQYESMGFSASVEVPIGLKDDAGLVVTDWVEEKLMKRLKELEQQ